jgi:lysophospholipase L1-like esterase
MKQNLHLRLLRTISFRLLFAFFIFIPPALLADGPTRVACVGDSITYGFGLKDRKQDSYPAWLGRWLGTNYVVRNFGHSGATLLNKGNLPYEQQKQHAAAIDFKPDIIVIMLGTNDSKHRAPGTRDDVPDNWQYKDDYVHDYEALIGEFRSANPAAKFYVCDPTPCFSITWGINDDTIHHEIIPLVHQVAKESSAQIIDFYDSFAGKKDLFPDSIHPNDDGAKLMAAQVYTALTGKTAP